ncbi:hypothetical protein HY024_02605 [Candidatus Curtissbacteria bacterium]|nr:hypothetical protein [Candidatus Curtissbacteria bacterium]
MRVSSVRYIQVDVPTKVGLQVSKVVKILVVLALPLVLSGCIPFGLTGGDSGGGNSDQFVKGAVAPGFPPVPLIPKAQTVESYGNNGVYGASFVSSESLSKVVNFYNENLQKGGWESQLSQSSSSNFVFNIKNDKYAGTILVNSSADPKKTAITMSLVQKDKAP